MDVISIVIAGIAVVIVVIMLDTGSGADEVTRSPVPLNRRASAAPLPDRNRATSDFMHDKQRPHPQREIKAAN
jgi:hypothetical protein